MSNDIKPTLIESLKMLNTGNVAMNREILAWADLAKAFYENLQNKTAKNPKQTYEFLQVGIKCVNARSSELSSLNVTIFNVAIFIMQSFLSILANKLIDDLERK